MKDRSFCPQTWSLDPDDRRICVDHETGEFRSIRLRDTWAGVARIGDVEVTVSTRGDLAVHELVICQDTPRTSFGADSVVSSPVSQPFGVLNATTTAA